MATMFDHGTGFCGTPSDTCLPEMQRFERALELRERALGAEHPLTRVSRVNLAVVLAETGERRRSEALLRAVEASAARDRSTLEALVQLAEREELRGRRKAATQQLLAASRLADELMPAASDPRDDNHDRNTRTSTRWLLARAALRSGDYEVAQSALQRLRDEQSAAGSARFFDVALAEVLCASGRCAEAATLYDEVIRAWLSDPKGIDLELFEWLFLARAEARKQLGRGVASRPDVQRARHVRERGAAFLRAADDGIEDP